MARNVAIIAASSPSLSHPTGMPSASQSALLTAVWTAGLDARQRALVDSALGERFSVHHFETLGDAPAGTDGRAPAIVLARPEVISTGTGSQLRRLRNAHVLTWGTAPPTGSAERAAGFHTMALPMPVTHEVLQARVDAALWTYRRSLENDARDDFLAQLDQALAVQSDAENIKTVATRLLGTRLGVSRCLYADMEEDQDTLNVFADYTSNVPSVVGRHRLEQFGTRMAEQLRRGENIAIDDVAEDPRTRDSLASYQALQVGGSMAIPVLKNARLVAVLSSHSAAPRRWLREEVALARAVANRCWDSIERARAERALVRSEARLRELANTIPNLAWMANADGWIHWYNDRWYAYTGKTHADMEGWGWQSVHDQATLPAVLEAWTTSIATGKPFEMTFPLRGADGRFRPFLTLVAPLHDAGDNIVQWFGTNTDVSPLKAAEEQLREADRRKDEFLAMLAHELRNPLAPIRTAGELLRRAHSPDPRITSASEIISRQVLHMTGLLDELLDVSRVTRGLVRLQPEPVDMAVAIANAVEQALPSIESREHRLTLDTPGPGIHVFADPMRLVQILANLLQNAAKYTPRGGHITLSAHATSDEVRIAVQDTGVGIEPALLPRLFEPFSQGERGPDRSEGGLGLGLAVVKGLVELHQGTVTASSGGPGMGSRFEVCLPRLSAPQTQALPAGGEHHGATQQGLSVLIVDDNVDAAETLAMLLETSGYRTQTAFTAIGALAHVKEQRFDVAILDIGLPDMTGYDLARQILSGAAAPPALIALTGYGQQEDRSRAIAAGFIRHLVKPVDPAALFEALRSTTALTTP